MPELAAHLERFIKIARQVAHDYDVWCERIDDPDIEKLEEMLAAALAACAREARLEVLHRLPNHAWPDKTSYPQEWGAALANAVQDELWKAMEENRAALERAVGEKATGEVKSETR